MASAMAARSSSPRDPSTTRAPRAASSRAVAAPIPRPAPVTATTFPETCLSPTPVTEASTGLRADEVGDDSAELFAGVFLQKVARAGDHRAVHARRATHGALEGGSHGPAARRASSWRKWPAPVSTGGLRPAAPGTVRSRTGAMDPVIGSRSLKATRNGLSHSDSRCQAARLAALAGSSG